MGWEEPTRTGSMLDRGRRAGRLGSAEIVVRLGVDQEIYANDSDGATLTVVRPYDGAVLLTRPVSEGDWDRLWAVLESFGGGR